MIPSMYIALALVAAYLVGSVNFALIVGRMNGVDFREVGSGNPGASNVMRTLGKGPAIMVLVGDALKGVVGASFGMLAHGMTTDVVSSDLTHWVYATGLAAVIGHCYPVFHKFKGGKGVATGFGVLLFAIPISALISVSVWFIVTRLTKVASIASMIVMVITIPLAMWQGAEGLSLVWIGLTILLVVWRHKDNIRRMITGSEEKVVA